MSDHASKIVRLRPIARVVAKNDNPISIEGLSEIRKLSNQDWVDYLPTARLAIRLCDLPLSELAANFKTLDPAVREDMVRGLNATLGVFETMTTILQIGIERNRVACGHTPAE